MPTAFRRRCVRVALREVVVLSDMVYIDLGDNSQASRCSQRGVRLECVHLLVKRSDSVGKESLHLPRLDREVGTVSGPVSMDIDEAGHDEPYRDVSGRSTTCVAESIRTPFRI